eukprot:3047881-Rhodomonas_salina.3
MRLTSTLTGLAHRTRYHPTQSSVLAHRGHTRLTSSLRVASASLPTPRYTRHSLAQYPPSARAVPHAATHIRYLRMQYRTIGYLGTPRLTRHTRSQYRTQYRSTLSQYRTPCRIVCDLETRVSSAFGVQKPPQNRLNGRLAACAHAISVPYAHPISVLRARIKRNISAAYRALYAHAVCTRDLSTGDGRAHAEA